MFRCVNKDHNRRSVDLKMLFLFVSVLSLCDSKIFNSISQSTLEVCLSVSSDFDFHAPICTWCCTQPS